MAIKKPDAVADNSVSALNIFKGLTAASKPQAEQKKNTLSPTDLADKGREFKEKFSASAQPVVGIFRSVNSFIKTNKLDRVLAAFAVVTSLPIETAGQVLSMIVRDAMKHDDKAQINRG